MCTQQNSHTDLYIVCLAGLVHMPKTHMYKHSHEQNQKQGQIEIQKPPRTPHKRTSNMHSRSVRYSLCVISTISFLNLRTVSIFRCRGRHRRITLWRLHCDSLLSWPNHFGE